MHSMDFKRILQAGVFIIWAAVSAVSCVTNRKIAYLQDMTHGTQIELENKFEAVISPYDELDIIVSCYEMDLAKPFNLYSAAQGAIQSGGQSRLSYLVDQDGNIEMPVLGVVHAAGLTRLQLQQKVRDLLIDGNYLSDPYVMVRFRDFKVFFIGSNGGKAITVTNERCTFLEALALSGDVNVYTDRGKITVMREVDGKMVTRYLDPRSSKVFKDPFFMLQQNDFIITRNTQYRNFLESYGMWTPIISIFSIGTSVVSLYLTYKIYTTRTTY